MRKPSRNPDRLRGPFRTSIEAMSEGSLMRLANAFRKYSSFQKAKARPDGFLFIRGFRVEGLGELSSTRDRAVQKGPGLLPL